MYDYCEKKQMIKQYETKQVTPEVKMIRQIKYKLDKSKDDKQLIQKVAEIVNVPNIMNK
jgi:hypothetical protein